LIFRHGANKVKKGIRAAAHFKRNPKRIVDIVFNKKQVLQPYSATNSSTKIYDSSPGLRCQSGI
jgi:hypothetical protein